MTNTGGTKNVLLHGRKPQPYGYSDVICALKTEGRKEDLLLLFNGYKVFAPTAYTGRSELPPDRAAFH